MVKEVFLRRRVERERRGEGKGDPRDAVVVVNPSRGRFWITASFIVFV